MIGVWASKGRMFAASREGARFLVGNETCFDAEKQTVALLEVVALFQTRFVLNLRIGTSMVALQDGPIAKFTNFAIGYGENRYEISADAVLLNISSSVREFSALRLANWMFSIALIASQSNVVPVRHEAQPLIVGGSRRNG
jgi:hypothetical protein